MTQELSSSMLLIPIAEVGYNSGTTPERCAQTVAAAAGWQTDLRGTIYSRAGVYIGESLTEVAAAMIELGWISDSGAGAFWGSIDDFVYDDDYPRDRYDWHAVAQPYRKSVDLLEARVARQVGDLRKEKNHR